MDDKEIFVKLAQCEDKEQMQRCIDEINNSRKPQINAYYIHSGVPTVTVSCEDADKVYITFPDGLRLIFKGGEYVGWYVCGTVEE